MIFCLMPSLAASIFTCPSQTENRALFCSADAVVTKHSDINQIKIRTADRAENPNPHVADILHAFPETQGLLLP